MNLIKQSQLRDGHVFKRGEPLGIVNDDRSYLVFEGVGFFYDALGTKLNVMDAPRFKRLTHFHRDFLMILVDRPPFVVVTYNYLLFLTNLRYEDH